MILDVATEPNPILRKVAKILDREEILNPNTQQLINNMVETMYLKDGAGIAAPQVEQSLQICVIAKVFTPEQKEDLVLINPSWKRKSILKEVDEEGCLSVPDIYGKVKRYKKIKVAALDRNGEKISLVANNFLARVIQHEIDHLNGILFIDKAKNLRQIHRE